MLISKHVQKTRRTKKKKKKILSMYHARFNLTTFTQFHNSSIEFDYDESKRYKMIDKYIIKVLSSG